MRLNATQTAFVRFAIGITGLAGLTPTQLDAVDALIIGVNSGDEVEINGLQVCALGLILARFKTSPEVSSVLDLLRLDFPSLPQPKPVPTPSQRQVASQNRRRMALRRRALANI